MTKDYSRRKVLSLIGSCGGLAMTFGGGVSKFLEPTEPDILKAYKAVVGELKRYPRTPLGDFGTGKDTGETLDTHADDLRTRRWHLENTVGFEKVRNDYDTDVQDYRRNKVISLLGGIAITSASVLVYLWDRNSKPKNNEVNGDLEPV